MNTWAVYSIVGICCVLHIGCKKSDTERLEKIGRISKHHALKTFSEIEREHLCGLPEGMCLFRDDTAYHVQQRLKGDKVLHKYHIHATGTGKTVLLKGQVETDTQRQRAKAIALETVDVEEVKNGIQLKSEIENEGS